MTKLFHQRWLQLTFVTVVLFSGAVFYWPTDEKPAVVNIEPSRVKSETRVAKKKKTHVVLKAFVTACQKLSVTIPLDAGFVTQSDDLRVIKGYVENRGNTPVQFVKLQVVWLDEKDKALEYDEIYVVTENVLMPGKKVNFQSSKRNILIAKCNVRVQDWWVVDAKKEPA